jgi:hypothetical protein
MGRDRARWSRIGHSWGRSAPRTVSAINLQRSGGFALVRTPQVAQDQGEIVAAGQGAGVVGAQNAGACFQHGAVPGFGLLQPP